MSNAEEARRLWQQFLEWCAGILAERPDYLENPRVAQMWGMMNGVELGTFVWLLNMGFVTEERVTSELAGVGVELDAAEQAYVFETFALVRKLLL
jgi:hypothetical protein